jgi:hypothetical protein
MSEDKFSPKKVEAFFNPSSPFEFLMAASSIAPPANAFFNKIAIFFDCPSLKKLRVT